MVKTRSQTGNITIKKEEEDVKTHLLLNGASNKRRSNRIAKRKTSKSRTRNLSSHQVKVEEDTDTKTLLKSASKTSKREPNPKISQDQINRLIRYVVNDNMSITAAARKVNISPATGLRYYNLYKNDPYKNIPSPQNSPKPATRRYTPEQIKNLIRYISQDKMPVIRAAAKANMVHTAAYYFYTKFLKDPNFAIPLPNLYQCYTQDQKNEFIDYVANDKMSITAASKKAKMNINTARNYYCKYFKVQNPGIPAPSHINHHPHCTQEQIKELIGYVVDDKMTLAAASRKANFCKTSARRHYQQYLKDNNIEQYVPSNKPYSQDRINQFIRYVVDDKMTIKAASKKANMSEPSGSRYYRKYLKNHNLDLRPHQCIQDKIKELIRYIVNDKMTLTAASKKANMSRTTSRKYYHRYLKDHHLDIPQNYITQDQKSDLIGYIVDGKMTITAASKKANMHVSTGCEYYRKYLKDHNLDYPIRKAIAQEQKSELIGYIIHDKMSINAAAKKASMSYASGYKYYQKYLDNRKCDGTT